MNRGLDAVGVQSSYSKTGELTRLPDDQARPDEQAKGGNSTITPSQWSTESSGVSQAVDLGSYRGVRCWAFTQAMLLPELHAREPSITEWLIGWLTEWLAAVYCAQKVGTSSMSHVLLSPIGC
jgi:hypothetical protein